MATKEKGIIPSECVLISKGIGIFFVVVSHFHPESSPTYWIKMNDIIYTFHMPLFFLLSGYLYTHGRYSYFDLIRKKIKRLLYPFITIATLFLLVKYIAGFITKLDYPVDRESMINIVINPVYSYVPLLWFVHTLFIIFVIYPLLRNFFGNFIIIFITFVISAFFLNSIFLIGNVIYYSTFFIIGVLLKENGRIHRYLANPSIVNLVIAKFIFIVIYIVHNEEYSYLSYFFKFILGICGSLVIIYFSQFIYLYKICNKILLQIGYYSMSIYLLHTLFESTVRIGLLNFFPFIPFEIIAFSAISCGIIFPLLLEKFILRKSTAGKKYILGIS